MAGLLERLGGFAARRPWIMFLAWLIILGGLLAANRAYGGEFVNNYSIAGTESQSGLDRLNSTFSSQGGYAGQIVFQAGHGTVSQQQAAINQATGNVSKLPDVIKAVSPFSQAGAGAVAKSGTIAYSSVSWSVNPYSLDTGYLTRLNNAVAPARDAGLQVEYGGGAGEIGQVTKDTTSELIGLSCALILLLLMFGSLIAAAIPLISAVFSVGAGLALLGLLAAAMTFPTTAPTVATLLGLGVAIDYGLFLVARHREQLDTGMDPVTSARRAEATSGAAIVVAGTTVVISILGLYISGVAFVGALGLAAALVVAITMAAALTLVPAFMGVVKGNVRALSARIRAHRSGESVQSQARRTAAATQEQHEHSAFARWGRKVSERPLLWAVVSVVLLGVLAIPLFSIYLGQPDNGTNPTSDSNRRAYDLMSQGFGVGSNGPLAIVVVLPKQSSSASNSLLTGMQKNVAATPGVASVSPVAVNSAGTTAVFNAIPVSRPQSGQTTALVSTLRDTVLPKSHATTYVTGTTAGQVDFTNKIKSRLIWLILAVVAIAFVLLTCAFRSVVIATKAAILNLLSIGASYGVIVAIFEWGWGKSLIGLHTTLPIPAYVPMLVFAIVFGLSMDYEVFLISRVHEAWLQTRDPHRAVAIGIGSTARVITTAAAIMVTVFTSFVLNSDPTIKMLAIGMAFAVLIDASLVRMVLVPSVMTLLGEHAWWMPRFLEPVVPHLQLEGGTTASMPRYVEKLPRWQRRSSRLSSVFRMKLARSGGSGGVMAASAALLIAGPLLAACGGSNSTPQVTARSFLADWARRDWHAMRALVAAPPASFAAVNAAALADLSVQHASYRATGRLRISGSTASEPVAEQLQLTAIGTITVKTVLRLVDKSSTWLVDWSPATIAPQLKSGDKLAVQVSWPPRAQILGANGAPLTTQAQMVTVGVEGQRIKDEKAVTRILLAAGAPAAALAAALTGAKSHPTWFEPVYTIPIARYQQLQPTIYPIPGTVFQTVGQRAPVTPGLGYVVGSVGPVTAQQLQQLGAPYSAASTVGQTGLELAYQRQLAGQPGATVVATTPGGAQLATVATLAARPGPPLQTSIDPRVQADAEAALAGLHKQAALVAVNASTGQVLASASVPDGTGFNIALDGAFPPGSSFKVITSTALLEHGLTPGSAATCPQQLTVDGAVFHNSEGTAPISDLLHAFAESCNTAFIGLATRNLTAADFPRTAAQYRIGTSPQLGLPAYGGSVPQPADEADLAATTIGQGRVLVSPLDMAMVAAAVDSGQVHAARLVAGAPDDAIAPAALPPAVVSALHTMMAQVVATGTASGKGLPPGTFAKTGTAQYGSGHPLPQDAWLMGFNGNIAFAMVVVNGGEGGPTDGPFVARFLDQVNSGG